MKATMNYYEVIFANDESIAIRSLVSGLTVEEATRFTKQFESASLLAKYGKILVVAPIEEKEVHSLFDDSHIDTWPIAVRSNTLKKEYEKYQTQWMIDHGHTVMDLIHELEIMREESDPDMTLKTIFEDWEFGYGFGSEIWACFEEWKGCEGKLFFNVEEDDNDK